MQLQNITLELSGKAFLNDSALCMTEVCNKLFRQWLTLTDSADAVSVLLWIADGSEILEYSGNLDDTFEWAYWCGCANHAPTPPNATEREKRNTHQFPVRYRADAAPRSYRWLKDLIATLRRTGEIICGKPIRIGATFDNGPEFAISNFKYHRHREIAQANSLYPNSFVVCDAVLNADSRSYAAFPKGIPQGTSLGSFLGAQFRSFAQDLGYDYIWLSNGMGFGRETWGVTGALFDKHAFHKERIPQAAAAMLGFWQDFYSACPGVIVETRGSNYSAGTEIATDAAPLRTLYRDYRIAPPVNSPWAALNFNSGLELSAWMSHIAELPDQRIPYRFYAHDPWFCNSPWLDRYGREPWDIYLPLAVSRISETGAVESANRIAILSADDTQGQMPGAVPREVSAYLLDAIEQAPDSPAPLVWVYPFEEYSDLHDPARTFSEDQFLGETLQAGTPLNTVISTRILPHVDLRGKILIAPITAWRTILPHLQNSGNAILYGTCEGMPDELWQLLGLSPGKPMAGTVTVSAVPFDKFSQGSLPQEAHVLPQFDGGALSECQATDADNLQVLATAQQQGEERILASIRTLEHGNRLGFVRSVLPLQSQVGPGGSLDYSTPGETFPVEKLMRQMLAQWDWSLRFFAADATAPLPRTTISRHDNAFRIAVFSRDTTVSMEFKTPYGAPLMDEMETLVANHAAMLHPPKSLHKSCRCFVSQTVAGHISSKIEAAEYPSYQWQCSYGPFQNAEVCFFPPQAAQQQFEVLLSPQPAACWQRLQREPLEFHWEEDSNGRYVRVKNVTGYLYFAW